VLVGVADDSALKNVASLVAAFNRLRQTHAGISLELVGRGLGPADPLARSLGEHARGIAFHGVVGRQRLATVLRRATVFVHPSLEESFGMVLLEAMVAGLPIVAGARSGAVPWTLGHGKAGVLVDVTRPGAIADAVAGLLADPDAAQELVTRGYARLERCFSPAAVADGYLRALETIRPRRALPAAPVAVGSRP
jgi:glycosyltransferase involved in cell wall biosynthesis